MQKGRKIMDTTNSSRELHLTVANEDYLECMVRIESEEGETNGVRSVDIAPLCMEILGIPMRYKVGDKRG